MSARYWDEGSSEGGDDSGIERSGERRRRGDSGKREIIEKKCTKEFAKENAWIEGACARGKPRSEGILWSRGFLRMCGNQWGRFLRGGRAKNGERTGTIHRGARGGRGEVARRREKRRGIYEGRHVEGVW